MRSILTATVALLGLASCADPHAPPTVDRLDCYDCHAAQFEHAPKHVERGYSHDCYTCHGNLAWSPAAQHHVQFPIDREPHAGYDCSSCHPTTGDFEDYSCIDCHAHTEGRTAPWHLGMGGFEYEAKACYRCHRSPGADD